MRYIYHPDLPRHIRRLVEMARATHRQPTLVLYGTRASGYAVEWQAVLGSGSLDYYRVARVP